MVLQVLSSMRRSPSMSAAISPGRAAAVVCPPVLAAAILTFSCQTTMAAQQPVARPTHTRQGETSVASFVAAPSEATWEALVVDVRAGKHRESIAGVVGYVQGLEQRELPNSMAIQGVSPDEKVRLAQQRCDRALDVVRTGLSEDIWRVLAAMAFQDDDILALAGFEMLARLSPDRFNASAERTLGKRPNRKEMIARVRQRWAVVPPQPAERQNRPRL